MCKISLVYIEKANFVYRKRGEKVQNLHKKMKKREHLRIIGNFALLKIHKKII